MGQTTRQRSTFVYAIASLAALAGLLFGYDTGVISGAILYIKDQFNLTSGLEGKVVSVVLLGAVIGAAFSGPVADRWGRRRSLIATAILFLIGALGCAFAPDIPVLIICRFLVGLAIGVASYVAPLYISEISPAHMRGGLVSLNQLMITCGIVVSYLVNYAFTTAGAGAWRWMFGMGIVPAVVLLIGMMFLPESPRWLVAQGLVDKAKNVLGRVIAPHEVDKEINNITKTLTQKQATWKEVFDPWIRPALFVGIILAFLQQATGINTIIYYAPTIFEFAGFGSHRVAILATVGVGVVNVLMTVVAIWLLDKLGRKPLLYIGMAGMALSLAMLGFAFHLQSLSGSLKTIAVISVVFYIASFAIGLGPIFWLIISEIYPLRVRGRAMSLATVANWGFNMLVAATFLTLTERLGRAGTFWLFALLSLVGLVYCYFFVPETKGFTLEQIEEHLHSGQGLKKLGR